MVNNMMLGAVLLVGCLSHVAGFMGPSSLPTMSRITGLEAGMCSLSMNAGAKMTPKVRELGANNVYLRYEKAGKIEMKGPFDARVALGIKDDSSYARGASTMNFGGAAAKPRCAWPSQKPVFGDTTSFRA
ncbi:hypothetical protein T484DRAFT_1769973 [Baffinella frigidus]|nr:hypothetical protein T484DRAFT_1769973 [Cryptophyta sp. CCMP2293]